jgi:hypothetical protein
MSSGPTTFLLVGRTTLIADRFTTTSPRANLRFAEFPAPVANIHVDRWRKFTPSHNGGQEAQKPTSSQITIHTDGAIFSTN